MIHSNFSIRNLLKTIHTALFLAWAVSPSLKAVNKPILLDGNGHLFQISSISQSYYEKSATKRLEKPLVLDDEKGLCGLFALYQAHCLLQAFDHPDHIDNQTQINKHILNLNSTKAFHHWIKKNEAILQKTKQTRGRLGSLTSKPIKKWAKSILSSKQYERFESFCYSQIKDIDKNAYSFTTKFPNNFQNSQQLYVVVFNLEKHWITVAFNNSTTWIADSSNISRVSDNRVLTLDLFMREQSTSGFVQNAYNKFKSIISPKKAENV